MTDLRLDRTDLETAFATGERYGTTYWPRSGQSTFPDGMETSNATAWARYVRRALGERARIYGFWGEDNPSSRICNTTGGHDFAVVDERYVVDGWLSTRQISGGRTVFDLSDAADRDLVSGLYGDITSWEREEALEGKIDGENAWFRGRSMTGTSFLPEPVPVIAMDIEPEAEEPLAPAFG